MPACSKGVSASAPYTRLTKEVASFISPEHYPEDLLDKIIDPNQLRVDPAEKIVRYWWARQIDPQATPFEFHHVLVGGKFEPRVPRRQLDPVEEAKPLVPPKDQSDKPKTTRGRATRPNKPKSKEEWDSDSGEDTSEEELPHPETAKKARGGRLRRTTVVSEDEGGAELETGTRTPAFYEEFG